MELAVLHSSVLREAGPFQLAVELLAGLLAVVLLVAVAVRAENWLDRDSEDVAGREADDPEPPPGEGRPWWTSYGPTLVVLMLLAAEVGLLARVADWT